MFQFYVTFGKPSNQLGMYIDANRSIGCECIPVKTADEFKALIEQRKPEFVMFQVGRSFPQRAVDVSNPKLYQHINRMIRVWGKLR